MSDSPIFEENDPNAAEIAAMDAMMLDLAAVWRKHRQRLIGASLPSGDKTRATASMQVVAETFLTAIYVEASAVNQEARVDRITNVAGHLRVAFQSSAAEATTILATRDFPTPDGFFEAVVSDFLDQGRENTQ